LADGAREDVFKELLMRGMLPNILEHIVERGSYTAAVTVFPSTTGPAYTPFLMGKFPGRCNLPGIRWFDRKRYSEELFSLQRMRSYVGMESFLMNGDISKEFPTLFELVPHNMSILNELSRGAVGYGNMPKLLSAWHKMRANYNHSWSRVDLFGRELLLKSLETRARYTFYVLTGIDHYSHLHHPFHKEVIGSYLALDETVGEMAKVLKKQGRYDDTLMIISNDHGLTPTHTHFDSVEFMKSRGYKTLYYPLVFMHWTDAEAANMISGNSMTHLYVKSSEGWARPTAFDELGGLVDALLDRDEVDVVAGVEADGKTTRIKSARGEARAWLESAGGEGGEDRGRGMNIRYELINCGDPFGYDGMPRVMSTEDALRLSVETAYPDALLQLIQLFESPRSGDLVVSAKEGYDLRVRFESPEHSSSHGALVRDHMMVPLAMSRRVNREFVRTVDIFPTVLRFLGVSIPDGIDGACLLDDGDGL